ncbi:MAG: hypothetical protein ABTD50_13630 [Polyangiaceae bacterium]|jgi:hypothetical protein
MSALQALEALKTVHVVDITIGDATNAERPPEAPALDRPSQLSALPTRSPRAADSKAQCDDNPKTAHQ